METAKAIILGQGMNETMEKIGIISAPEFKILNQTIKVVLIAEKGTYDEEDGIFLWFCLRLLLLTFKRFVICTFF